MANNTLPKKERHYMADMPWAKYGITQCPSCGSARSRIYRTLQQHKGTIRKHLCRNCQKEFLSKEGDVGFEHDVFKGLPVVQFHATICPHCGSTKTRIYKTIVVTDDVVWRKHICRACKDFFVSEHHLPEIDTLCRKKDSD